MPYECNKCGHIIPFLPESINNCPLSEHNEHDWVEVQVAQGHDFLDF